ncbi:peptidoglycan hydrolase-like protein with peptidoglycan-binding domain [Hamadaea flava]|uniref:Peptidoglycan-binding protein n=1 Tax=Hamadaea flava TaxID=1742688 RepID=A0ABV8LSS5_9ACTN|nr:peptidoglycan-binding protein [Hamadaea flava]MCP2327105.1 peptidoglycan hydrolase-like protein with peptidoglycan-binding domain [Hamadaea flava]
MRRRILTGLGTAAVVLAIGVAVVAAKGIGSGPSAPSAAKLPPATATVTRQTLVDSQTESGELGYGDSVQVNGKLPGTITALPAQNAAVRRGQPIYRVDNNPVVLLYGVLPAYRALVAGMKGPDVKQFEQNLYALGYRGFTVDGTFSASTTTAVKKWQKALGVAQTGVIDLGRVYYAPGPVRVNAQQAAIGDSTGPGMAVLDTTGSQKLVGVELSVAEQRLAQVGSAVTLKLPDGKTVPGKIVRARTVIKPAEGNNPAKTVIRVSVAPDDQQTLAAFDQATIDVGFTAGKRENVLTVPVAALLALSEGGYGVQVVDGSATRIVAVRVGLFATGRVEVTGDGLREGATVGMPS